MDNQPKNNQHREGRLINFRCFVLAGVCAALGIFGVSRIYMGIMFWGVAALVGGAGIIVVALVWTVKSGFWDSINFLRLRKTNSASEQDAKQFRQYIIKLFAILVAIIIFVIAIISAVTAVRTWDELGVDSRGDTGGAVVFVSGVVTERVDVDFRNNRASITLRDVRVDGRRLNGRLQLTVTQMEGVSERLRPGDVLRFETAIRTSDLIIEDEERVNNFAYRRNIRYRAIIREADIEPIVGSPNLGERIRGMMWNRLNRGMPERYAAVAYGMLIGDRTGIDRDINDAFGV
ncbi:MAG: hypothetical protein FWC80_04870, partial [Firmicutes bacterium]|nr:hypothetical protein [Bacillota bacterium]